VQKEFEYFDNSRYADQEKGEVMEKTPRERDLSSELRSAISEGFESNEASII